MASGRGRFRLDIIARIIVFTGFEIRIQNLFRLACGGETWCDRSNDTTTEIIAVYRRIVRATRLSIRSARGAHTHQGLWVTVGAGYDTGSPSALADRFGVGTGTILSDGVDFSAAGAKFH